MQRIQSSLHKIGRAILEFLTSFQENTKRLVGRAGKNNLWRLKGSKSWVNPPATHGYCAASSQLNWVLSPRTTTGQVNPTDSGETTVKWTWKSPYWQEVKTFLTSLLSNFAHGTQMVEKATIDLGFILKYVLVLFTSRQRKKQKILSYLLPEMWPTYFLLTAFTALSSHCHGLHQPKCQKEGRRNMLWLNLLGSVQAILH